MDLREKGDQRGALDKLRAAHALGNTPLTGLELCRTHAALKQPVEAREVCLGVGRIPPLPQETSRSQEARAEAARLAEAERPKIGALRLKVTGVPAGWEPTVVVDGAAVPAAALGEPRAVNPGMHSVSARVGSGVETKASLETREGEVRDIELIVQPPPASERPIPVIGPQSATPPPPNQGASKKNNAVATAGFTIGGVAAIVGAVAGLVAMGDERDLEKQCVNKACGRELHDDLDAAKTWGNVSTTFFVIAGIGIGAGLIATAVSASTNNASAPSHTTTRTAERPPRITPVLGLGGAGLHGSF